MANTPVIVLTSLVLLLQVYSTNESLDPRDFGYAIDALYASGFGSMAKSLRFGAGVLVEEQSSITVFAASDEAYAISGKPSLSLLHFHISPTMMTVLTLKTMSVRTKIPTLLNDHFLMVTSVRREISINLVKVNVPPVYESVSVIVYGVNSFFDLSFDFDAPIPTPNNTDDLGCSSPFADYNPLYQYLERRSYAAIGRFLDLQLLAYEYDEHQLTIFAFYDREAQNYTGNASEFSAIFRRHVVPCKLTWSDLVNLEDGVAIPTFSKDFTLKFTRTGDDMLAVNGVPITFPQVYEGDAIVIHGILNMLNLHGLSAMALPYYHHVPAADAALDHHGAYVARLQGVGMHDLFYRKMHRNRTPVTVSSSISLPLVSSLTDLKLIFDDNEKNYTYNGMEILVDPGFKASKHLLQHKISLTQLECSAEYAAYQVASNMIKSHIGHHMALFLEYQLFETKYQVTIFAPMEGPMFHHTYYYIDYSKYVVPCKLTGRDLFRFKGTTILPTLSKNPRFTMIVEQLDKIILVNSLPVYLDMYSNEMLTVHELLLSLDSNNIRSGTPDEILR